MSFFESLYGLEDRVAVVTGGAGTLGTAMVRGLADAGANVGILGRTRERAERLAAEIEAQGGAALPLQADVLQREQLRAARERTLERWGRLDILVNSAGGNLAAATVSPEVSFFDLPPDDLETVVDVNFQGTLRACQVFGEAMARQQSGCIVNISSMAAQKPLTRVVGYAAAKAAVENLTRWLAAHLARNYSPALRVNAIAPGFFIAEQNRDLLLDEKGQPTPRGQTILQQTPMARFGKPKELVSTLLFLCGPGARFVSGVVVPVDGGFSAFGGV
jgi:NAD(P)-dependent dehydrogenase (short-subunit alcohol dehydrogenase family)